MCETFKQRHDNLRQLRINYRKASQLMKLEKYKPLTLVLAEWFVDARLKIHGTQFFKVVIYLPNLIMASAFAMLFFSLKSEEHQTSEARQ